MDNSSGNDSPTQFLGKSLNVEIFNNNSEGIINEVASLDEVWKNINKETCEAGRIANSVCLKLLRGDVKYSLVLEKVLENIIYLLNSDIGGVTAVTESSDSSPSLMCLALGEKTMGTMCPIDASDPVYKKTDGAFGHSSIDGMVIISNDLKNDPRSKKRLPKKHPAIHRFLSIPLKYQNTVIGLLSVANSDKKYTTKSVLSIIPLIDLCSMLLIKSLDTKETLISKIQSINNADVAKDKFLATMSHELRTPLNGIMGMINLFPDAGPLNTKQREYIKNLMECTVKLTALLNNLLDFSKMSSDRLILRKKPFSVQEAIDESTRMIGGNIISKGLDLKVDFPNSKNIPNMIGDRQRLVQVLSNLLSNSVKFTDKGSVSLSVDVKQLSRRETGSAVKWEITFCIKDTGIGIIPEEKDKIFEVFYQSSNLTPFLSNSGTGLGLPISRELVRLMGGKLSVNSDGIPGNGTVFTFYIILDEEIDISSILEKDHIKRFEGSRILIVDDRPEIRLHLSDILFKWKCIPIAVSSAEEALQYLQYGMKFKAALVDINMPQMSGIELAQEIRGKYPNLPLIGISSVEINGGENYFDFYMYKPINQNTLFPALVECITKPRGKLSCSLNKRKRKSKRKLNILVAEDDLYNRFTIKEMLISLGYSESNIVIVENGLKCVQEAKRDDYDVIFMDIVMPGMDGLEASKLIKRLPSPPMIIAVSAAVQASDKDKCQNVRIDGWLSKPIIIRKLEASLLPLIKVKRTKSKITHSKTDIKKRSST